MLASASASASASSVIYSLVETANANDLESYIWLGRILRDLSLAQTVEDIEALMTWNLLALDPAR